MLDALLTGPKSTAELCALLGVRSVASYVLRLRRALGDPSLVRTTFTGYRLELPARPSPVFQLPAPVTGFVGRDAEVSDVLALLPGVAVVSGPPGVGKTALAVTAGHAVRSRFPDGQLYVNLRGHAAEAPPAASVVLARFLRALGVSAERLQELSVLSGRMKSGGPPGGDPCASLAAEFRRLLHGTRFLIVLDNAASADQIRPLLPHAAGCGVLITSRTDLPSFPTIRLGPLTPEAATSMIRDPELAQWCGYYPLALRIALGNLIDRPDPQTYVEELRQDRLGALSVDGDLEIKRAFALSHAALEPPAARLFGLLGVIPGQDFGEEAAKHLFDGENPPLDVLEQANLIHRTGTRYGLHDLLRDFAAQQPEATEEARANLQNWYLDRAMSVGRALFPELNIGTAPDQDADAARRWLDEERPTLFTLIHEGPPQLAWQIINAIGGYLATDGHAVEFEDAIDAALDSARRHRDEQAEAQMLVWLGGAHRNRGDYEQALETFLAAERMGATTPWLPGYRAELQAELGLIDEAKVSAKQAREAAHRNPGLVQLEAGSLHWLGIVERAAGELAEALAHQHQALELTGPLPNLNAAVLLEIGRCHRLMGEPEEALAPLEEAARLRTQSGTGYLKAEVLAELARAHSALHHHREARAAIEEALELPLSGRVEEQVRRAHQQVLLDQ